MKKSTSQFALTSLDHRQAGGTPPEILERNPGKKLVELLDETGICELLEDRREPLQQLTQDQRKEGIGRRVAGWYLDDLTYLSKINRLPTRYQSDLALYQHLLKKE